MTFNVNWGMPDALATIAAIRKSDADIVCLQEVHPQWEAMIRGRLAELYPSMIFHHHKHPAGGLVVLARRSLEKRAVFCPPSGWFPAMLVQAETPIGTVDVLTVHLRPPVSEGGSVTLPALAYAPRIHRQEIEQVMVATKPTRPLIVCGDFNENDDGAAMRWLRKQGLADALARFNLTSNTWHWTTGPIYLSARYDHILFSPELDCLSAHVTPCESSDHRPVTAVFQAKPLTP